MFYRLIHSVTATAFEPLNGRNAGLSIRFGNISGLYQ